MATRSLLIITNGDVAARRITETGIAFGDILPWRDVLYEGPVPKQGIGELRASRAAYLASSGYGDANEIADDLEQRDNRIAEADAYDEVVMWFEHDLYDQLQLLQVLDRLAGVRDVSCLSLIVMPGYIGSATSRELAAAYQSRATVDEDLLVGAQQAWKAFTESTPNALAEISRIRTHRLIHLPTALDRLMEEFPDPVSGTSRTERFILEALCESPRTAASLFSDCGRNEDSVFMSDRSFWNILSGLASSEAPLISVDGGTFPRAVAGAEESRFSTSVLHVRGAGRDVLDGYANAIALRGLDRWIGGTHLRTERHWCWDSKTKSLSGPHSR